MNELPLIKVSRASINEKLFDITEEEMRTKLSGEELEKALLLLPTEDEKEWMKIYRFGAPELARAQRKMSVCLDVEVDEYREDFISYTYSGSKYSIKSPVNSFRVSESLEKSKHAGFEEMCKQGCVTVNEKITDIRKDNLSIDEMSLLIKITDKFFFQIYLG